MCDENKWNSLELLEEKSVSSCTYYIYLSNIFFSFPGAFFNLESCQPWWAILFHYCDHDIKRKE